MGRERDSGAAESRQKDPGYSDPREEYVCSPQKVPLQELAARWRGTPGCGISRLLKRSASEGWLEQRRQFWDEARRLAQAKIADQAAGRIVQANDRHIQLGMAVQEETLRLLRASKTKNDAEDPALRPGERLRAIANLSRVGVDIERRGLGLADQVVYVEAVREITRTVLTVIARYVKDPDIYGNIVHDLQEETTKAEAGAADGLLVAQPLESAGFES